MTNWANRMSFLRIVAVGVGVSLIAASCGGSAQSSVQTSPDGESGTLDTLPFVAEATAVTDADFVEVEPLTTEAPSSKAQSGSTTISEPNSLKSGATTVAEPVSATCLADDYEVPVPSGWNAVTTVNGPCAVFATIGDAALECDCTVGVTVRSYQGQTAASRVLDWMTFGAGSPTQPTSISVLGGKATLVTGQWELHEVQTGSIGQFEERYMYVFDDGANSVEVTAGEFQDWGGNESFADRKAAVDKIAAGLVLQ